MSIQVIDGISGTDNMAYFMGYVQEYIATSIDGSCDIHVSVKKGVDLDGYVRCFDHDNQEFITLNGWMWSFSEEGLYD